MSAATLSASEPEVIDLTSESDDDEYISPSSPVNSSTPGAPVAVAVSDDDESPVAEAPSRPEPKEPKELWFFSGSKDPRARYLSNFASYKNFFKDRFYHTLEAAFQAAKADPKFSDGTPEAREEYCKALQEATTGLKAKQLGSKSGFRNFGLTLNVPAWEDGKLEIMRCLLAVRAEADDKFSNTVLTLVSEGYVLKHFVRGKHYRSKTGELVSKCKMSSLMGDWIVEFSQEFGGEI